MAVNEKKLMQVVEIVRETLAEDGGDIEVVTVQDDGTVVVSLSGSCAGCDFSKYEIETNIEKLVKQYVEGVTRVVTEDEL